MALSTLISSLSLYDTQLFLFFHPSDFQVSITHLQNALTQIISGMTSNLLSLNSSKTEFVLIGLKMHACSWQRFTTLRLQLTLLSLLATLASYLMNISHSPSRSLHCLNPATITSALFVVSVPTLTFTPPKRLPQHASPHLWNQLPASLRIPHPILLFIPLSATIVWTCRFNLLNSKLCYHLPSLFHCFTLSSKLKNYLFQKILSSTLVCFCLSKWSNGSRPLNGHTCSSVFMF